MKSVAIIDWPDLKSALETESKLIDANVLAESILAFVKEDALSLKSSVDRQILYTTVTALGSESDQQSWHSAGFEVVSQPGASAATREKVIASCLALGLKDQYENIYLICGNSDYKALAAELKKYGVSVEILGAAVNPVKKYCDSAADSSYIPQVSDGDAYALGADANLPGVLRLIRAAVIKRTQDQLSSSSRSLSTHPAVDDAFLELSKKILESGFTPVFIVAWTDQTRHWNGSLEIAARLNNELSIPILEIGIREEGEGRRIVSMPEEIVSASAILIVDDAAFTGGTLRILKEECGGLNASIDARTAVMSSLEPVPSFVDFWARTHSGVDVLFPWGWARSVDQFYDLLRQLGTRDRRWMPREVVGDVRLTRLTDAQTTPVTLFEGGFCEAPGPSLVETGEDIRITDHLIYIVAGRASINIGGVIGDFQAGEFLFIPRVVPYSILLQEDARVLRLESADVSDGI